MNPAPPVTSALIGVELSHPWRGHPSIGLRWQRPLHPTRSRPSGTPCSARRRRSTRRLAQSSASSARRSPSWATTRRTRRCCSPPRPGRHRARSPSACGPSSTGSSARARSGSRSPAPDSSTSSCSDRWHRDAVADLLAAGDALGASAAETPEPVLVEFVSANPTGPVTAASGRGAAFGDAVAALLAHSGHHGRARVLPQRRRLPGAPVRRVDRRAHARRRAAGRRLRGRVRRRARRRARGRRRRRRRPRAARAAGDRGDARAHPGDPGALRRRLRHLVAPSGSCASPARWSARSTACARAGTPTRARAPLWLRTTEFGDDKDRVLVRSDGEPTYFAPDIAYHLDKLARGARAPDQRARRRPPRLRAEDAGRARRARLRPRALRGADHADGQHRRGRPSGRGCPSAAATS